MEETARETVPIELGQRIRSLRKEQGLSLEQLAAKSGVALATLSRLENGKGPGTFRTHRRITEALGIPLPEFYLGLEEPSEDATLVEPGGEEPESFTYDEKASAVLLTRQVGNKQMLPQLVLLKPGSQTPLEQYPRGTERWLYALEGKVEVVLGERRFPLKKGGTLYFKAVCPHRFRNNGTGQARLISVTSPVVL